MLVIFSNLKSEPVPPLFCVVVMTHLISVPNRSASRSNMYSEMALVSLQNVCSKGHVIIGTSPGLRTSISNKETPIHVQLYMHTHTVCVCAYRCVYVLARACVFVIFQVS